METEIDEPLRFAGGMQPQPPAQWIPPHVPVSGQDETAVAGRYDAYLRAQRAVRPLVVQGDGGDLENYGLQAESWGRHASQRMPWGPTGDMPTNIIPFPAQPADRDHDLDLGLGDATQGYVTRPKAELPGAHDWPRGAWSDPGTAVPPRVRSGPETGTAVRPETGTAVPGTPDGTLGTDR